MSTLEISPTSLRDYAKSLGWVQLPEAVRDRLYVLSNPKYDRRQLVIPMDTTAADYGDAVSVALDNLALLIGRPTEAIVREIESIAEDNISFGITSGNTTTRSLPLDLAASMINGAQQLLRASACTVLTPRIYYPRLSRSEAEDLLHAAKFRHTEPGSFVFNVSCPLGTVDAQHSLLADSPQDTFSRRTTATLVRAAHELVHHIEEDTLTKFVEMEKATLAPIVSSNFCEALAQFHADSLDNALVIGVRWAASLPPPIGLVGSAPVVLRSEYFGRIEEVAHALRPKDGHEDDTFVGTVEALEGEIGDDGRRAGNVVLSLQSVEGELVRARASLNSDQYRIADSAHMSGRVFVKISGRLHPGRQPRLLSDVTEFDEVQRLR